MKVQEEPTVPVVVITLNERTDEFGNLRIKQTLEPTGDKVRDMDGAWEKISRMRFDNLSSVEPWINGGPELRHQIRPAYFYSTSSVSLFGGLLVDAMYDIRRRDINDEWYTLNSPYDNMFFWERGQGRDGIDYGPGVEYTWWEEDNGGNSQPINITPTVITPGGWTISANIQFTIGNNDDFIGSRAVIFSDPEPTQYGIGNIFRWESLQ